MASIVNRYVTASHPVFYAVILRMEPAFASLDGMVNLVLPITP